MRRASIEFLIREFRAAHPVVDLRVLGNRNFSTGLALITLVGIVLYGTTAAIPIFLQTLMGYTALDSGLALSPRGLAAFVSTLVVGRLVGRVRSRYLLITGFSLVAASSFMLGRINLTVDMAHVIWPSVVNGMGISFIFVPLTTSTVAYLRQDQMGNATGLYNLMRNIGGSIGIAFVTTMLARDAQVHQAMMVAHTTPYDPAFVHQFAAAKASLPRTATRSRPRRRLTRFSTEKSSAIESLGVRGQFPAVRAAVPRMRSADFPFQTNPTPPARPG